MPVLHDVVRLVPRLPTKVAVVGLAIALAALPAGAADFSKASRELVKPPELKSSQPRYIIYALGFSGSKLVTMILDESGGAGTGYDTLYVDYDGRGDLTDPDKRVTLEKGFFKLRPMVVTEADAARYTYNFSLKPVLYEQKDKTKAAGFEWESTYHFTIERPGQKAANYTQTVLPSHPRAATAASLAQAPVYHVGGPLAFLIGGRTAGHLGEFKFGDEMVLWLTASSVGSSPEHLMNFYHCAIGEKRPSVALRVLRGGKPSGEIPFTSPGCSCAGGSFVSLKVLTRIPSGTHEVVVRKAADAYQGAIEQVYTVLVDNPMFGAFDADPDVEATKKEFAGSKFVVLARPEKAAAGMPVIADTYLRTGLPADAGSEQVARIGSHPESTSSRALIRIDLSAIPAKAAIQAARLKLFFTTHVDVWAGSAGKECSLQAFLVKKEWGESGPGHADAASARWFGKDDKRNVAWEKPLCDGTDDRGDAPVAQAAIKAGTRAEWLTLDLTAAVRDWLSGKAPNNGIILIEQPAGTSLCGLLSSECPDVPLQPRLIVAYSEGK